MPSVCGIDFGTSNSSLGYCVGDDARLVPLQGTHTVVPTAVFFSFEDDTTCFGREAMERYLSGEPGRLLRSIKTLLGTALFEEMTQVRARRYHFGEIIAAYLGFLRQAAAAVDGVMPDGVVMGRPAFFVDDDVEADAMAERQLRGAAELAGFKRVEFQYEPIAAALYYEQSVTAEQVALVADIGGGTSDFSLVRVGPERRHRKDRRADILGYNGVRVGGTDFDRQLSVATLMPVLGRHSPLKTKGMEMPAWYYVDLATWHLINGLYEGKVITGVRSLLREAGEPEKIERLLSVLERRKGHELLARVEEAKIALSAETQTTIELADVVAGLGIAVGRDELERSIAGGLTRIEGRVTALLAEAGLTGADVGAVFLTGGSSGVPAVRAAITAPVPKARVIAGDAFGSVGTGLAIEARRRLG